MKQPTFSPQSVEQKGQKSSEQLSQSAVQQSQQSQRGGNNNVFTTGNVGDQLKQQKDEISLQSFKR
jgi:hypothetical protein